MDQVRAIVGVVESADSFPTVDELSSYVDELLAAVPDPNLDHKLDFDALMQGKASDPGAWSSQFRIAGGNAPGLLDIGKSHLVRARQ